MKTHKENNPTAFQTLKRLISLGKPYWGRYFILCMIVAILSLTSVAIAESLRRIVNATVDGNMSGLISGCIFAVGVVVVDGAGNFAKTYLSGMLEFKSIAKLQASVLSKLMKVRMEEMEQYHSADLISRINDSAPAAQTGINEKTIDMFGNILKMVFMLTYLVSLQYMLTLGTILICTLIPLFRSHILWYSAHWNMGVGCIVLSGYKVNQLNLVNSFFALKLALPGRTIKYFNRLLKLELLHSL